MKRESSIENPASRAYPFSVLIIDDLMKLAIESRLITDQSIIDRHTLLKNKTEELFNLRFILPGGNDSRSK
jgi:hypothetical protein